MRFLHTADLHIGRTVNDFSMLEDQRHILRQILETARERRAEAVVIAGDIYDRSIPPSEAVTLLDEFLTRASSLGISVILTAGNHDSPERLGFASRLLENGRVYIAGRYEQPLRTVRFFDEYGETEFVCLPFLRPGLLQERASSPAVEKALKNYRDGMDGRTRCVLVAHQFVTAAGKPPELSDSETSVQVGGLDNVDASVFRGFDYVALGHIHKPQRVGEGHVYYAGSPLKYSFSEVSQTKTVNLVTLREKGSVLVEPVALSPLHEMRMLRGPLEELIRPETSGNGPDREDYIKVCLTDTRELIDPIGTLRKVYPNVMQLTLAKNEAEKEAQRPAVFTGERRTAAGLFEDFYREVRGEEMDEERRLVIEEAVRRLDGGAETK